MLGLSKIQWLWVWFGVGIAVLVHGVATGGGIAGLLLSWQLEAFGVVFPVTHVLLAVPLILVPLIMISRAASHGRFDAEVSGKRWGKRFLIGGLVAAVIGGLCYWRTTFLPSPDDKPQRIVLDEVRSGAVPEQLAVLVGTLQPAYRVRYKEVLTGRFGTGATFSHSFVPVTESDWSPGRPVRFLVDSQSHSGDAGLLLRGELPAFVRWTLEKNGLRVADDVLVLSSDPDFGRTPWLVSTGFCAIGTFVGLVFGLVLPWSGGKSQEELEALRPRVVRYFFYGIGGALMLLSVCCSIPKAMHIAKAASTTGVITGSQESRGNLGRYSFWVKYSTPHGTYERFAETWTPYRKNVGEKVTVLYSPSKPEEPEILAFDTDWLVYLAIFFLPGLVIAVLGRILVPRRREASRLITPG
jgi:hypothetical protein